MTAPNDRRVIRGTDALTLEHTPGGSAHVFAGEAHGLGAMTFAVVTSPKGGGTSTHRHPYVQIFLLLDGSGIYCVGDEEIAANEGDLVIVPSGERHSYCAVSEQPLVHVEFAPVARPKTDRDSPHDGDLLGS